MAAEELRLRESYQYVESAIIDYNFIDTPLYTAINEMMKLCKFGLTICNESPIDDLELKKGMTYYIRNPFVDKIEIIGAAQVCVYHDVNNSTNTIEIHNLCVSPVARRRGIMSSILNKIHNEAADPNKNVMLWLGVDINHELFEARVGQYAKQGFMVHEIGQKSFVGIIYPNAILIGMTYEPEFVRNNGAAYKSKQSFIDNQVNRALKMRNDFNTRTKNCSKMIGLSTNLLNKIRQIQSNHQTAMGGMFYITNKEYDAQYEGIYTLGAATGDRDLTHSISGDGCGIPMGFDTSKKIYYHTHPSRCNNRDVNRNACKLGWPSHKDLENYLYYFIEYGQKAQLIFADEGIYITKPTSGLAANVKALIADKKTRLVFYKSFRDYMDKTMDEQAIPCPDSDDGVRKLMEHISGLKFSDIESFYYGDVIQDAGKTFGLVTVDFYSWNRNISNEPFSFIITDYPNRKSEDCEVWEVDENPQNLKVTT
jgi:GNAT superfamily N-acetyltransferase